jgi:hypothetical protein
MTKYVNWTVSVERTHDKLYEATFRVRGSGEFPFDMLRYDCCYPINETEARRMSWAECDSSEVRTVELRRKACKLRCDAENITPARWQSFGWRVLQHDE